MTKVELIASIKADLVAKGVNLTGPCGAFEITKRVAFALRGEGFGLLSKPTGNNCEGFAVDIICLRDGTHFDILIKGGGAEDANGIPIPGTGNEPAFQQVAVKADPSRFVAPFSVDPVPTPDVVVPDKPDIVPVVDPVVVTPTDLEPILAAQAAGVERILAAQAADTEKILAAIATLRQEANDLGKTLLPQILEALLNRPR